MVKNKLNDLDDLTRENIALAMWMKKLKSKNVPKDVQKRLLSKKKQCRSIWRENAISYSGSFR